MLQEHLDVTGLTSLVKLKHLTDPDFYKDFETKEKKEEELKISAVRKATELKKIIKEKVEENEYQFQSFAERIMELIKRFDEGLLTAKELLEEEKNITDDLNEEINSYKKSGLNKKAHGIYKILDAFKVKEETKGKGNEAVAENAPEYQAKLSALQELALEIDNLYQSDETAPVGWHLKEQLRKELRQQVRKMILSANLTEWKKIPQEIESYALKYYVKIA